MSPEHAQARAERVSASTLRSNPTNPRPGADQRYLDGAEHAPQAAAVAIDLDPARPRPQVRLAAFTKPPRELAVRAGLSANSSHVHILTTRTDRTDWVLYRAAQRSTIRFPVAANGGSLTFGTTGTESPFGSISGTTLSLPTAPFCTLTTLRPDFTDERSFVYGGYSGKCLAFYPATAATGSLPSMSSRIGIASNIPFIRTKPRETFPIRPCLRTMWSRRRRPVRQLQRHP